MKIKMFFHVQYESDEIYERMQSEFIMKLFIEAQFELFYIANSFLLIITLFKSKIFLQHCALNEDVCFSLA